MTFFFQTNPIGVIFNVFLALPSFRMGVGRCSCQDQQEGTQMQNERNKYLLKHKTLQGGAQGEQSWNYSKQQERTKPPEVDSLESSPSWYQWKIICTRLGWQTAWGNQQAGSLRLVEQDWREHTAQTRQHAKHVIKGKNKSKTKTKRKNLNIQLKNKSRAFED